MMNRFQNNKGAVSVSYAALMVFGVGALVAISPFYGHFVPLCNSGPLDYVCSGSITGDSGGSSGEGDTNDGEIVIGDNEYDPDPSTPMKGPWIFGAGQAYNRYAPGNISYPGRLSEYQGRYFIFDSDAGMLSATGYETGYVDEAGDWVQDPSGDRTQTNEWFAETRSLELDDSVDCSLARLEEEYGGYCLANVRLDAKSVQSGVDRLGWIDGDPFVVDYGELAIDTSGESIAFDLSFEDAETELFGRQPRDLEKQLKVYLDNDESSLNVGYSDNVFLEVDARGNDVTIDLDGEESTLALGDGYYETNNGMMNHAWWSDSYANTASEQRYEPRGGGVIAAYPAIESAAYGTISMAMLYADFADSNGQDQHRVDLSHTDGWSIKECVVEEVPFIRDVESTSTSSNGSYGLLPVSWTRR